MSKIVTLSEEEVEILLSHHKQKLTELAKELEALTEKQRFSQARLHDLTDHPGNDETSGDPEMEAVHANGTAAATGSHEPEAAHEEDLVFAPEAIHDEAGETSPEGGASHEPESGEVGAEHEQTAHEKAPEHAVEANAAEGDETPDAEEADVEHGQSAHAEVPEQEIEAINAEHDETAGEGEHAHEPAVEGYLEKAKTFLEEKLHNPDLVHPDHGETSHTEAPAY